MDRALQQLIWPVLKPNNELLTGSKLLEVLRFKIFNL